MFSRYTKIIVFVMIVLSILVFSFTTLFAQTPEEEKKTLEAELKVLEDQIAKYEDNIGGIQKDKKTLQNQISLLQNKVKKLNLQISQGSLMVKDVGFQIQDTEKEITITSDAISETRLTLVRSLRALNQESKKGNVEVLLGSEQMSDFFTYLTNLETLSSKVSGSLTNIESLKISLEKQKGNLDKEKEDLRKIINIQVLQKKDSETNKQQQEVLLRETSGKEAVYQQYLAETKAKAAQIRSRIFELAGIPQAPTFGQAYEIAKLVSKSTGVRPAFLLAIITQESNLGKNVGQCNCPGQANCKYPDIGYKEIMKQSRDWQPFLQITQELGRDPNNTPVSCPMYMNGKRVGYGGAMGPAQFIPSTWMIYKSRVEAITGKTADPWNIYDAFLAAALYVKDYGAASQKENDEWRAAMIYFSGSTNVKYRFYGDSVLNIAKNLEDDIRAIEAQN